MGALVGRPLDAADSPMESPDPSSPSTLPMSALSTPGANPIRVPSTSRPRSFRRNAPRGPARRRCRSRRILLDECHPGERRAGRVDPGVQYCDGDTLLRRAPRYVGLDRSDNPRGGRGPASATSNGYTNVVGIPRAIVLILPIAGQGCGPRPLVNAFVSIRGPLRASTALAAASGRGVVKGLVRGRSEKTA